MQVEVNATDVDEYKTDDRGRITLGSEHANAVVTVALVDSDS